MRAYCLQLLFSAFVISVLPGCDKAQLSTGGENSLSDRNHPYIKLDSEIKIFHLASDSDPGLFVTQLDPADIGDEHIDVPKSVYNGNYGNRSNPDTPHPVDLIVRVYNSIPATSGDFYFETAIFGKKAELSNVTTALSWILRWGFPTRQIHISSNRFSNLLRAIEIECKTCRSMTNSQVVAFALSSTTIKKALITSLAIENPGLSSDDLQYTPPIWSFAYSRPTLTLDGKTSRETKETSTVELSLVLLSPINSLNRIQPEGWEQTFQGNIQLHNDSNLTYTFSYDAMGKHLFKPLFSAALGMINFEFEFNVSDTNRNPYCQSPLILTGRSNKNLQIDLSTACSDPDSEDTNITYSLISGPAGLTISSLGILRWTPPQNKNGEDYGVEISFLVADSKQGFYQTKVHLSISSDAYPIFTDIPTTMTFSEGTPGVHRISARDLDGDPIVMRVFPISSISTKLPAGSGVLNNIVRSMNGSTYDFDWTFQPSWMQTIGQNGTVLVKLVLYYDPSDTTLNSSVPLAETIASLMVINSDDPPLWIQNPTDIAATEGVPFSMTYLGEAVDSMINPTNVSYSIENLSGDYCDWILQPGQVVTDQQKAYFNSTPSYASDPECTLQLLATDANGLVSKSSPFVLTLNDTNRNIVPRAGPFPNIIALERQRLLINLIDYFDDPDFSADDPREVVFQYQCNYDSDNNGTYESICYGPGSHPNISLNLSSSRFTGTWTPSAVSSGIYNIEITVIDKGGSSATNYLTIEVQNTPAPMSLDISLDGINNAQLANVTENQTLPLILRARAATPDVIDNYAFQIQTPICVPIDGGTCRVGFLLHPTTNSGVGDTDLHYNIQANFDDGNSQLPGFSRRYNIIFTLENSADASMTTQTTIQVTVENTNRPPTAIGLSNGSFGCTGSLANANTEKFTICVDASRDTKVGMNWQKTYAVDLTIIDPDLDNDVYEFQWLQDFVPSGLSGAKWQFKLPRCVVAGSGTITRTFTLQATDGRGGIVQREVDFKIQRAATSGSCMQ